VTLTIKLFGVLKSLTGQQQDLVVSVEDGAQVQHLVENLQGSYPDIGDLLLKKKVLISVNHEIAHWDTVLAHTDEIALLPPFAGGSVGVRRHQEYVNS